MGADQKNFDTVGDIPVRSETIGFSASEMIACPKCGKANAPNRYECLYCGSAISSEHRSTHPLRFKNRELESWEKGFNVIAIDGEQTAELASILTAVGVERERVDNLSAFQTPTPLFRVSTREAAESLAVSLRSENGSVEVVADEALSADSPPVRIRSLAVEGDKLILTTFNANEVIETETANVKLIVPGVLIETRSETTLKKSRGEYRGTDDAVLSSDSGMADIYVNGDPKGFRIITTGFDFAFLGDRKGLLASLNLKILIEMLSDVGENVRVIDDYSAKRKLLDAIWPPVSRNDSKGAQRSGMSITVSRGAVTNNIEQFTKYSRMLAQLL